MKSIRTIYLLLFTLVATGCLGQVKLRQDMSVVTNRIDELRTKGEICAPGLLAEAEVEIAVAEHHVKRGHGMIAADHIAQAFVLMDEAAVETSHPGCATLMGPSDEPAPEIPEEPDFPVIPLPPTFPVVAAVDEDRDGDGVTDSKDQCPDEPGDPEANGCIPDTDGDGLPDYKDSCPTKIGSPETGGCPYRYISIGNIRIRLKAKINFRPGNRKIAPESVMVLDEITVALKDRPRMRLRIAGHTDSKGSDRANQAASRKRAETVRRYLMKNGIDGDRLITIGYGESQPIDDNSTEAGREANRRIEFHILQEGGQ